MTIYRAIANHTRSYETPLVVKRGDPLSVGQSDSEWPGWLWCVGVTGMGGWLPARVLADPDPLDGNTIAVEDFDTMELTIRAGELLQGDVGESGWLWVTNAEGRSGWVPETTVEAVR